MTPDPGEAEAGMGRGAPGNSVRPPVASPRAASVVLAYTAVAALWILLSDRVVEWLVPDPGQLALTQTVKGWGFVAVTSLLLYTLLRRNPSAPAVTPAAAPVTQGQARARWLSLLPFLVLVLVILGLTGVGILHQFKQTHDKEAVRLGAIAGLKAGQAGDWLAEREANAQFIRTSRSMAEHFRRWWQDGDAEARERLQTRLGELLSTEGFSATTLIDPLGGRLWASEGAPDEFAADLADAVARAPGEQAVERVGPYVRPDGLTQLDFVVPLNDGPVAPVVVLHTEPNRWLLPALASWPVPSETGRATLCRRDGNRLLLLTGGDSPAGAIARATHLPLDAPEPLPARLLRREIAAGELVAGRDHLGTPVLAVAAAVPGSDLHLIAKVDRREVDAVALAHSAWIALSGLLALAAAAGFRVLRQRHRLALSEAIHQVQAERLRALSLLDAIVDASEDAIFAKNLQGRYILCNRAAARLMNATPAEVLGRKDGEIFPPGQADMITESDRRALAQGGPVTSEETLGTPAARRVLQAVRAPLRDAVGTTTGVFGIARDMTARKAAEDALRESEAVLREAQRLASLGHWAWDFRAGKTLWSDELFRIFGRDPALGPAEIDEIAGYFTPESWARLHASVERAVAHGEPYAVEAEVIRTDGTRRWVIARGEPVKDASGVIVRLRGMMQDITAPKQAEQALRERLALQEQLAQVAQSVPGVILAYRLGPDGRVSIPFSTPAIEDLYGLSQAGLAEDAGALWANIHSDDMPRAQAAILASAEGLSPWHDCFRYLHPHKGLRWIEGWSIPKRGEDGSTVWHGFVTDVSERIQAEEALRASERRFQDIVDASSDWVWEVDADGRYTYASDSVEQALGYKPREMIGKSAFDLMPAGEAGRMREIFGALAARRLSFRDIDNITLHRDGSPRFVQTTGLPILDGAGALLGYRGVERDITGTKLAEQALRRSEERYRHLFEDSRDALIVATPPSWTLVAANRAALRLFGARGADDLLGLPPLELSPERQPDGAPSAERIGEITEIILREGAYASEWQFRRLDGSQFRADVFLTRTEWDNGIGIQGTVRDITEYQRLHAELARHRDHLEDLVTERTAQLVEARTRAEAAARSKSAFLANMSHEIRTPMNAILGLTHLLQRDAPSRVQAERLGKIDDAARHLLSLINDILDLSKVEAGRLTLERRDFALADLLAEVRNLIAVPAHAKGLSLSVDAAGLPPWLHGDSARLRQALVNYAGNAVKFTDAGTISLRARPVEEREDELLVRFEVRDTGIGISADDQRKLFRPFEQGDASVTRRYGGTGLGLVITRQLARLMGGEAGAESTPGAGSLFWFTARLARGSHAAANAPDAADTGRPSGAEAQLRHRHAGTRVLVVEDNPINREVAVALLQTAGLVADTAGDGREAVAMATAGDYALILMDMQMPVMDGLAAARALRALPAWGPRPILAMTANAFEEERQACLAAGMNDFIAKPVDPEALFATLSTWLPRRGTPPAGPAPSPAPAAGSDSGSDAELDRLRALPGLDLERAVAVLGSPHRLLALIRSFCATHGDDGGAMAAALAAGDVQALEGLAHTLKGCAGSLGIATVADAAARLHACLRTQGVTAEPALAAMIEAVGDALATLAAALGPPEDGRPPQPPAAAQLDQERQVLERMGVLLTRDDGAAIDLFRSEAALLRSVLGGHFGQLARCMVSADYPAAAEVLREVQAVRKAAETC